MKKHNKIFKIIRRILLTLAAIVAVIVITLLIVYHNLLLTALSIKQISNEQAYTMDLFGDMYFDDFMKTGIKTGDELETFLYNKASMNLYGKLVKEHGCSAFYAKTPDGDILLCNDIDLTVPVKQRTPVVMNINLGKKALEIGNAGLLADATDGLNMKEKVWLNATLYSALNGINEDGLAIAVATAFSSSCEDTDKPDLYDRAITPAVLNNASNVDEAIAFLEKYDVLADYPLSHFMIGDAEGNVAVVEWVDGKMVVVRPDIDYMIMSNFLLTKMSGFGMDRYNSYKDALSQCGGVLTEKEALKLLAENVLPFKECWSAVYNLTDKTVTVCFRANYYNSYTYSMDN